MRAFPAVIAAASLGLAACGSGGSSATNGPPVQVVTAAFGKTVAARTARVSMTVSVQLRNRSSLVTTMNGEMDFQGRTGELTVTLPMGLGEGEVRIVNGTAYEKLPGQPWRSQPVPSAAAAAGSPTDPSQILSYLQGVTGGVTQAGTYTIRGVPTTEYRANVDLAKVATTGAAANAANLIQAQLGTTTVPMLIWVDSQGLTRRIQVTMSPAPASQMAAQGLTSVAMTMDFYDFGVPVHVTAPG